MADNALIKILTALLKHQVKRTLGEETLGVIGQELAGIGGDKIDAWIGQRYSAARTQKASCQKTKREERLQSHEKIFSTVHEV